MATSLTLSANGTGPGLARRLAVDCVSKVHLMTSNHETLRGSANPSVVGRLVMLDQYDVIINLGSPAATEIHAEGYPVICGARISAPLSDNFDFFSAAMGAAGIPVLQHAVCDSREEFDAFAADAKGRLRLEFLHSGTRTHHREEYYASGVECLTSLVVSMPQAFPFIIFDTPKDAVDACLTGWFNGSDFVAWSVSVEFLRERNGGRGASLPPHLAAARATVVVDSPWPGFDRVSPLLAKAGFVGPISFHVAASETGVFCYAVTARPHTFETFELYRGTPFDLFWSLRLKRPVTFIRETAVSIRVSAFSFAGARLLRFPPEAERHVLHDNYGCDGAVASTDPHQAFVTARGDSAADACRRAMRTIRNAALSPSLCWRTDIGLAADAELARLKSWGLLDESAQNGVR